ncbi:MAG: MarR family transcriptional regulator [Blastomonas sp.]
MASESENPESGKQEEGNGIAGLQDILGFHIRLAHGAVYRHFSDTFSDLNLTQKQVSVLWLIDDHPGIAQADLARLLYMDRATTMTLVNRLQARHFLRREQSAEDGRKQTLFLEPGGKKILAEAKAAVREHEEWLKSRFTAREVKRLIELLTRIHD